MAKFDLDNANDDTEARLAIWRAICNAASDVRYRFAVMVKWSN